MENNIASILFARGIMPDDFISYSTYGAVAEIVKELKQLEAERTELINLLTEYVNDTGAVQTNRKARAEQLLNSLKTK